MDESLQVGGLLAWIHNGDSRYQEVVAAAKLGIEYPDDLSFAAWSIVELIEAEVRLGRVEHATNALHQLAKFTHASSNSLVLGIEARCRALVSDGPEAEALYRTALSHIECTRVRLELARTHLLYGEWLRRVRRRLDARHELRTALEMFCAAGLEGFADRTRRELLATGEVIHKRRSLEAEDELTPQEAEVSRLAGLGYTNPEIGVKLFISARTVEWHLRKVFLKLGIQSRRQLREAFRVPTGLPVPA